jgi:hypothetical protein
MMTPAQAAQAAALIDRYRHASPGGSDRPSLYAHAAEALAVELDAMAPADRAAVLELARHEAGFAATQAADWQRLSMALEAIVVLAQPTTLPTQTQEEADAEAARLLAGLESEEMP